MKGGHSRQFIGLPLNVSVFFSGVVVIVLSVYRASSEACLEGQSELESTQPLDDASLPSTSQEPTSSSAGTHHFILVSLFFSPQICSFKKKKKLLVTFFSSFF